MHCSRVLMCCDLGPTLGTGHVMRCLALAEEFLARGTEVVVAADSTQVPFVRDQIVARGARVIRPPVGPSQYADTVHAVGATGVVIDSYLLSAEVYAAVAREAPTLALVDGDPRGRPAHLHVDQNIGAETDRWPLPEVDGRIGERLAGLEYALIRDDIRARRDRVPPSAADDGPPRVLAVFGGTDPYGAAPVLTDALLATGEPFHLTVIAGNEDSRSRLAEGAAARRRGQEVEIEAPTSRLAELVADADLVVSAAGTSTWELLCLGAPCALVQVADNQADACRRTTEAGLAVGLGTLTQLRDRPAGAVSALRELLRRPDLRRELSRRGARTVDGRGRERVADALDRLMTRCRGTEEVPHA